MAGKKKKDGKGKKEGDHGKFLPPPNLDKDRQGAMEALLTFQIRGKEEAVCICEEKAEKFKDKNYQQQERNYLLKQQQASQYKALVLGAQKLQEDIDEAEKVDRAQVDAILEEIFELERTGRLDIAELTSKIGKVNDELNTLDKELKVWRYYKEKTRGEKSAYITKLNTEMDSFQVVEEELRDELRESLRKVKKEINEKVSRIRKLYERKGAQNAVGNLDKDTMSEFMDKQWLEEQITHMKEVSDTLRKEIDELEQRNIQFIRSVTEFQNREIQAMSDLYNISTGRGKHHKQAGEHKLPSLVDITKSTTDQGGGQASRLEMQLLSVRGTRPLFHATPDTVSLPPIEKQRSSHNALPPRTKWPISNAMLSSLLGAE